MDTGHKERYLDQGFCTVFSPNEHGEILKVFTQKSDTISIRLLGHGGMDLGAKTSENRRGKSGSSVTAALFLLDDVSGIRD